jgi:hypothetical protein
LIVSRIILDALSRSREPVVGSASSAAKPPGPWKWRSPGSSSKRIFRPEKQPGRERAGPRGSSDPASMRTQTWRLTVRYLPGLRRDAPWARPWARAGLHPDSMLQSIG